MTLAAILAKHQGGIVPAVPKLSRSTDRAENQAGRAAPAAPAVPVQKHAVEAIRAHLSALAATELIEPAIFERWLADDLAACEGLSDETLRACARAAHRSATMDAGTVPATYTQAAVCDGCGPVWLWERAPPRLKGCPWCFRRKAGTGFPRPLVTCGDCRHFLPDTINQRAGCGGCALGLPYRRGEAGRCWPGTPRECGEYRPRGANAGSA